MRCLLHLIVLALLTMRLSAQDAPVPKAAELFSWHDRLGFEDTSNSKFARIWTGYAVKVGGTRLEQDICHGFILEDQGDSFRAVLADLTVATFKKAENDPTHEDFCGYREASLEDEAERLLKALKNPSYFEEWEDASSHFNYFDRLSRHAQVFVLARECARREMPELAHQLVNALATHPIDDGANRRLPFPDWLRNDFADAMMWRAQIAYRDPSMTWSDIRAMLQKIPEECPDSFVKEGAMVMAQRITALLDADKTRKAGDADDPEELVWRLHDEQNEEWQDNYWPRPYPFEPRKSNGAMAALRAKGTATVPALIAELKGPVRPCRSASRSSRYGGGVWNPDTHELALAVLNDIAGFNIRWLAHGSEWARVLGAIDDWWRAVRRGEEREWLLEIVRRGGRRSDAVADRLLARFPEDFFDAAVSAIRGSDDPDDPYPRRQMIERLLKLKDARAAGFLLEEMKTAPALGAKASFASALRELGRLEGEAHLAEELRKLKPADFAKAQSFLLPDESAGPGHGIPPALSFLAESNTPASLQTLAELWPVLPFHVRAELVQQLARRNIRGDGESLPPAPEPAQAAIRDLLFLALEDERPQHGATYTYEGGALSDPRLCDLAADALHSHWPERFAFDRLTVASKRERQRVAILNPHLRALGRPELPSPKDRPQVPPEKANHLTDVQWDEPDGLPEDPLRNIVANWVGKQITAEQLASVLLEYARSPKRWKHPLELAILRDGDGTGVYLRVRRTPPSKGGSSIRCSQFVKSGQETTHESGGVGIEDSYSSPKDWEKFQRHADEAFRSTPETPFVIRVTLGPG